MNTPTRADLEAIMNAPHAARYSLIVGPRRTTVRNGKRKDPTPAGYAAPPGTGPEGETCGGCRNLVRQEYAKTYLKCGLNLERWTGGRKTDVLARSPACAKWLAPLEADV